VGHWLRLARLFVFGDCWFTAITVDNARMISIREINTIVSQSRHPRRMLRVAWAAACNMFARCVCLLSRHVPGVPWSWLAGRTQGGGEVKQRPTSTSTVGVHRCSVSVSDHFCFLLLLLVFMFCSGENMIANSLAQPGHRTRADTFASLLSLDQSIPTSHQSVSRGPWRWFMLLFVLGRAVLRPCPACVVL
jgi:hypothetical protein